MWFGTKSSTNPMLRRFNRSVSAVSASIVPISGLI
jgi:hypothetical protein